MLTTNYQSIIQTHVHSHPNFTHTNTHNSLPSPLNITTIFHLLDKRLWKFKRQFIILKHIVRSFLSVLNFPLTQWLTEDYLILNYPLKAKNLSLKTQNPCTNVNDSSLCVYIYIKYIYVLNTLLILK